MKKKAKMRMIAQVLVVTLVVMLIPMKGVTPVNAATNPYSGGYANCTWAAWQYAHDKAGVELPGFTGNAIGWYEGAKAKGYTVSSVPREKSIAVWSGGTSAGHVAYVDKVSGNRIYIYEGGYKHSDGTVGQHEGWVNASGVREYTSQMLKGYIYLGESISSTPATITVTTDTADGITKSNAVVHGTVKKSESQTVTSCGLYLGTSASNLTKRNTEAVSAAANSANNGTWFNIWYDLNTELGITLSPSTTYYYKIYAVYGGKEYTGSVKSFTTAAAVSILDSGTLSTGIKWTFDSTGKLSFSGSGAIPDWKNTVTMPWFDYYNKVTSVDLGGQVTSIGNYSFYDFREIEYVSGGQNVTKIGAGAFVGAKIKNYPFTTKVTEIGGGAFRDCTLLQNADISNVTSLGESAFSGCFELESITFSPYLQSIEASAFEGASLSKLGELPNGLKKIGFRAFAATQISKLQLPDGLGEIGELAFYASEKLNDLTIPENVTSIGRQAFYGCANLDNVTFTGDAPIIDTLAFYCCGLIANYPSEKNGWSSVINANYEGEITWKPYGQEAEKKEIGYLFFKDISLVADDFDNSKLPKGVSYDVESNTIVFNNCNIEESYYDDLIRYYGSIPLKVEVKGYNYFKDTSIEYGGTIVTSYTKDDGDASVYLFGDGVIDAKNYYAIVDFGSTGYDLNSIVSIDGVTIYSDCGGLSNTGGITIKDATIEIDNINSNSSGIITYNPNYSEGGKVIISNSNITLKNCPLNCREYDISNVEIYIDSCTIENKTDSETIFQERECIFGSGKYYEKPEEVDTIIMVANNKVQQETTSEIKNEEPTTQIKKQDKVQDTTQTVAQDTKKSKEQTVKTKEQASKNSKLKVAKVKLLKAKKLKGKKVKLTWKKLKGVKGYQIKYSTKKSFKKAVKTLYIKRNKKVANLKKMKKKIYYIKIRAYKKLKGKKVYGNWSRVLRVKM